MKKELTAIKKIADNELKRMVSLNPRFIIIIMSSRATQSGQEEFTKRALDLSDKNNEDKILKKIICIAPIKKSPMVTQTHTQVICFNAREKSVHFGIFAKSDRSAAFGAPPTNTCVIVLNWF
jgi:hypothetical protein